MKTVAAPVPKLLRPGHTHAPPTSANTSSDHGDHGDHGDHSDHSDHGEHGEHGEPVHHPDVTDWRTWLSLSCTPTAATTAQAAEILDVRDGVLIRPHEWPPEATPRVYVVYDDDTAIYVGQTTQPLAERIRGHFGTQRTPAQQRKASNWRYIVTATFPASGPGELDALERSAAEWLLPLRRRVGHRHPRAPSPM